MCSKNVFYVIFNNPKSIVAPQGPHIDYLQSKIEWVLDNQAIDKPKNPELLQVPNLITDIVFSNEFSHHSKTISRNLRNHALGIIERKVRASEQITFYLDLGSGYHASVDPGLISPTYTINMAEVILLYQIKKFSRKIKSIYSPGIKFKIFYDNIVANFVNDISFDQIEKYRADMVELINALKMNTEVEIIFESEMYDWRDEYGTIEKKMVDCLDLSEYELKNIYRFLGRKCSIEEAKLRRSRYDVATRHSDEIFNATLMKNEIRFVQNASEDQFCFRPYPGGASRIQCGNLGVVYNGKSCYPKLFTSLSIQNEQECVHFVELSILSFIKKIGENSGKKNELRSAISNEVFA